MKDDVIVIGAGAAGLTAAGFAAKRAFRVTLIEKNDRVARKVMITGKGRCNVTNACDRDTLINAVRNNGKFLYSAFSSFSASDVIDFFEKSGVPLKTERGNRVFPRSDKAVDIVDALHRFAKNNGVQIIKGRAIGLIIENSAVKGVLFNEEKTLFAGSVIIATGGLSYPLTGSTGDGYKLAEQAGHTIVPLSPSLVPLEVHENFCSKLQGVSLKNVRVTLLDSLKDKVLFSELGEMIFTHFGLSGPLILSASSHIKTIRQGQYKIMIDLKPALTEEQLDLRVQRDFAGFSNRDFINSLEKLLPRKMIPVMVGLSKIPPGAKVNQVTREQRLGLVRLLKNLELTVTKFRPIEEAVITSGGVDTRQINPKTMESKLVKGLYFAGEVIDVDAYTGGFNLQIAFSTGFLAGNSVNTE